MTESTPLPKALLICGHPRSGTTLLNRRFDAHPAIFMTQEMWLFRPLGKPAPDYLREVRHDWWRRPLLPRGGRGPLGRIRRQVRSLFFWRRFSQIIQHYANGQPVGVETVTATLNDMRPGRTYVGDKFPPYVYMLDELAGNPHFNILVIYRDVLDVTASRLKQFKEKFRRTPPPAAKIAKDWVQAIAAMQRNAEQVHVVQYEALVHNPEAHFDKIAEWLKLVRSGFRTNEVHDTSVGKTRRYLSEAQVAEVLAIAGPTRAALGYTDD